MPLFSVCRGLKVTLPELGWGLFFKGRAFSSYCRHYLVSQFWLIFVSQEQALESSSIEIMVQYIMKNLLEVVWETKLRLISCPKKQYFSNFIPWIKCGGIFLAISVRTLETNILVNKYKQITVNHMYSDMYFCTARHNSSHCNTTWNVLRSHLHSNHSCNTQEHINWTSHQNGNGCVKCKTCPLIY